MIGRTRLAIGDRTLRRAVAPERGEPAALTRRASPALEVPLPLPVGHEGVVEPLLRARVVEVVVDDLVAERRPRHRAAPRAPRSPRASSTGTARASDSYAFPSSAGGSSSPCSIPCSPAAITAANARYGFASPPGIRVSARRAAPWPTTRNPQVRLSFPHASVVGAQRPGREALVRVDRRREEQRELLEAGDLPGEPAPRTAARRPRSTRSPSRQSEEWM